MRIFRASRETAVVVTIARGGQDRKRFEPGRDKPPQWKFFGRLIDDRAINAIDELPGEFHEVLIPSDLGDLRYGKITRILDVPAGTVCESSVRDGRIP